MSQLCRSLATVLSFGLWVAAIPAETSAQDATPTVGALERPIANPVKLSPGFQRALERGTRTMDGVPGPNYWQQSAAYTIRATLDVEEKKLTGTTRIIYRNNSPSTLTRLIVQLLQNFHRDDVPRIRPAEITGGYTFSRIAVEGQEFEEIPNLRGPGYATNQTNLYINTPTPLEPGDSIVMDLDWSFTIPQRGAGGRMGWSQDNFFYLAYWYPQMAVLDDVVGWQADPFLGQAEFYQGFATYDVTLDVPEGWLVQGTGELQNESEVLRDHISERLRIAEASDTVVHVIDETDIEQGFTRESPNGRLSWHFTADSVRDVAFSVTSQSLWDVTRTEVGDRNGDGSPEYARAEAIFRPQYELWREGARYAQHTTSFHSRHSGVPYPYSHATAVEGDGIIGGGMEEPMMTIIGGYDGASDRALYGVINHEIAHNWVPMIVNTDERRRSWMDEGTTDFNDANSSADMYADYDGKPGEFSSYIGLARTGHEGALMRYSDHLDSPGHFGVHAYTKPGSLLFTLRSMLGEDVFYRAYQGYLQTWAFKHPKPWDFFNYFNESTGQNLDWFWQTWYYETWTLDQSIESVTASSTGTEIVIRDIGDAPMPTEVTITLADGEQMLRRIPVEHWLGGTRSASLSLAAERDVVEVEIDANGDYPDIARWNNFWSAAADELPATIPLPIRNALVRKRSELAEEGYQTEGDILTGAVGRGASDISTVQLQGGVEYAIFAVCDQDCSDIDLRIKDAADSTLAEDVNIDATPILEITAPITGGYNLDLIMFSCGTEACSWGGQIYRKR